MMNDFKNVLITCALIASVFVGGFFSYQKKIEAEDISITYQSEIQARDNDLENFRLSLESLQAQLADLKRQKAMQASVVSRPTQPKVTVPIVIPPVQVTTPVQPVVVRPEPKPKRVVVSRPSRRSRAS